MPERRRLARRTGDPAELDVAEVAAADPAGDHAQHRVARTRLGSRDFVEADSLGYLSIRGVLAALDLPYDRFCFACFDGRYPEPVPYDVEHRKFLLEEPVATRG